MPTTPNPWLTLIPAYARDYASAEEVLEAWRTGKDFRVADVSSEHNGRYINEADARHFADSATTFKIRFNRLEDFALIRRAGEDWGLVEESDDEPEPWTPEDILRQEG